MKKRILTNPVYEHNHKIIKSHNHKHYTVHVIYLCVLFERSFEGL